MSMYITPERCESMHRQWRCMREAGHTSVHQADLGRSPAIFRWGMSAWGCADPECIREPGHPLPHRDGQGKSWAPVEIPEGSLNLPTPLGYKGEAL